MKLSLSPETERLIAEKVDSGRYQSADEVVRQGLELLNERDNGRPNAPADVTSPPPSSEEEIGEPATEKEKRPATLYELFEPIWASVPEEEWEKLPRDLAQNYEHYLYGSKKQS
jgi:Arc/MetJ-type ribon-helix-helix transcriptional regulator